MLVVTDSSFLINFLAIDRLDILRRLAQFHFHMLNHVEAEVRREDQRARLEAGRDAGFLDSLEIIDPDEILLYDGFRRFLGDGESACLAGRAPAVGGRGRRERAVPARAVRPAG